MIALNELIKNKEHFEKYYNERKVYVNFSKIIYFKNKMEEFQLKSEAFRSDCNKFCKDAFIASDKRQFKKIINNFNRKSNYYNNKLCKTTQKLNKILNKLPNVPDKFEDEKILKNCKTEDFSMQKLERYLKNELKMFEFKQNSTKDLLMQNSDLPAYLCKKMAFCIYTTVSNFEQTYKEILQKLASFFEETTIKSYLNTNYDSKQTIEFFSKSGEWLQVDKVFQFYSRENNFKYKNQEKDKTEFVCQIKISYNKKDETI